MMPCDYKALHLQETGKKMQWEWNERMVSSSKLYMPFNTNRSQWWPLLLKYIQRSVWWRCKRASKQELCFKLIKDACNNFLGSFCRIWRAMCFRISVMACTSRFAGLVGWNCKIIDTINLYSHILEFWLQETSLWVSIGRRKNKKRSKCELHGEN